VVVYFLVGLWGHYINTAMNRAAAFPLAVLEIVASRPHAI
jgi:hypothetical protein